MSLALNTSSLPVHVRCGGIALALKPSTKISDMGPKINLEALIPTRLANGR